ncbi:RNA recognition motif domain containing protein [Entamoeba marina]
MNSKNPRHPKSSSKDHKVNKGHNDHKNQKGHSDNLSNKKLFVMGLPHNYTHEDFETLMGDVAPVKKAFIITKKGSKECTGNGYAVYGSESDAQLAKNKLNRKKIKKEGKRFDKKPSKQESSVNNDEVTLFEERSPVSEPPKQSKELQLKAVENEKPNETQTRTASILDLVLKEYDNGDLNEQSEDETELKLTRKERVAQKKLSKGQLTRKQRQTKERPKAIQNKDTTKTGHIYFDTDKQKKHNPKKTKRKEICF